MELTKVLVTSPLAQHESNLLHSVPNSRWPHILSEDACCSRQNLIRFTRLDQLKNLVTTPEKVTALQTVSGK